MTTQPTLGAQQSAGSHTRPDTLADLKSFAAIRAAFKASKFRETLLDILLIGGAAALICSVAASIPVSLFLLFVAKF